MVLLGIFDATLGVAWPSMRRDLHQPLSGLGVLLLFQIPGFLVVTLALGRLLPRFGAQRMVVASALVYSGAASLIALAPWPGVVAGAALAGVAAAGIDAPLNAHIALRGARALLHFLHSAWGFGTFIGPLLVTGLLLAGGAPRWAFLTIALGQLVLAGVAAAGARWGSLDVAGEPRHDASLTVNLALGLVTFFAYTGVEAAAGQWSFTVLTESRAVPVALAGLLVSLYWAGLTIGRVAGGMAAGVIRPALLVRGGSLLAVVAAALFWWHPTPWLGMAALPLLGLGLAPIFPGLMILTPERVGAARAASAVGYQAAVAGLGASIVPALVGLLLQRSGLERLGPFLVATAILLVVVDFAGTRKKGGRSR